MKQISIRLTEEDKKLIKQLLISEAGEGNNPAVSDLFRRALKVYAEIQRKEKKVSRA